VLAGSSRRPDSPIALPWWLRRLHRSDIDGVSIQGVLCERCEPPRLSWRRFSLGTQLRQVVRLELNGRDITAGSMEPAVIEPVDPGQGRQLDVGDRLPRSPRLDHLGLEEADRRLGQGVDAPIFVN